MQAALQQWPQPPARSNHWKSYGPLPDLWAAAQAGLHLTGHPKEQSSSCSQANDSASSVYEATNATGCRCSEHVDMPGKKDPTVQEQQQQQQPKEPQWHQLPQLQQQQQQEEVQNSLSRQRGAGQVHEGVCLHHEHVPRSCRGSNEHHQQQQPEVSTLTGESTQETTVEGWEEGTVGIRGPQQHQQQQKVQQGQQQAEQEQLQGQQQGKQQEQQVQGQQQQLAPCWNASGTGPAAGKLLQKLRWVTLGPPYDWTARAYDTRTEHLPLPAVLQQAAELFAAAAAALCDHSGGSEAAAVGVSSSSSDGGGGHKGIDSKYQPDAAIVNYYREGDTLGGHKDDVEAHMTLPIVSISLGCPAVFLIGGESKEEEPLAMILRSGDVVVLAGEARRCFHGVPRILSEQGLPAAVQAAADQDPILQPFCRYMSSARVNISIRDIK